MTRTLSRRNPKPSRVMNVLYSTFVAGTSSPPLSLFLLSGHVLDVACCLLEESNSSGGLVHRGCYCSLIFKLSDNSCRKNYIWLLISLSKFPLMAASVNSHRSYQLFLLQAPAKLMKTTNMLGNSV